MIHFPAANVAIKAGSIFVSIARKARDTLSRWMFLPTLKVAHKAWLTHRSLGSRWTDLGEGIEYSDLLARSPEGPGISRIALRSLNLNYECITVNVEAIKGESVYRNNGHALVYDETRIVSSIGKNPRVITLSGIPPYETYITDDGALASTYDDYRVRVTSVTRNGITQTVRLESPCYTPVDQTLAQPYLWKQIGESLFHIGEIVWAKDELRNAIYNQVGNKTFASMLMWDPFLNTIFWVPYVLRLKTFKAQVFKKPE